MLVFDIESDGLLPELEVIHCLNVIDRRTGKRLSFNGGVYKDGTPAQRDGTIEDGLLLLMESDAIAGHKIIWYDIPAIKKIYPWFRPTGRVFDSLVCAQVIWTNVKDKDFELLRNGKLRPDFEKRGLIGKHSLEAWGWRLGRYKGDFDPARYKRDDGTPHTWKSVGFSKDMDVYGRQDVEVTLRLIEKIEEKNYSQECLELEHRVSEIIFRQHERGFAFDMQAAEKLTALLQRRQAEISGGLQKVFKPWWAPDIKKGSALFTPKRPDKKRGYTAGVQFTKVKLVVFNPASRPHIANRLRALYDWKPTEFTDGGQPKIDESTLDPLPWPEAKLLLEYLTVEKRLGQVATGKKAWLTSAVRTGLYGRETDGVLRIHGNVNTNGAVTGRMTHNDPNVAQCPKVGVEYGAECRACFIATPGLLLVGCDAEGLELRCLAHFMARYDDGAYVLVVVNGKKEDGTDVHTVNMRAAGLNTRDSAKTFIYALIYGAGDFKLGSIVYDDLTDEQRVRFHAKYPTPRKQAGALKRLGTARRARIMTNLPALGKLVEAVKAAVKRNGYLKGLDGRLLHIRSEHSALNTLLQSAGAIVMKRSLVLFEDTVAAPLRSSKGATVEYVANIHDESQQETNEQHAEKVGRGFAECIRLAGTHYNFRCPLAGSYGIGKSWASTH
jgi:hypothetical protein